MTMRSIFKAFVAAGLFAASQAAAWQVWTDIDPMTDEKIISILALLSTITEADPGFRFLGEKVFGITGFVCEEGTNYLIFVFIDPRGKAIPVGFGEQAAAIFSIRIRFDKNEPTELNVFHLGDDKALLAVIGPADAEISTSNPEFLPALRQSETLLLEILTLPEGDVYFNFAGLRRGLDLYDKHCG